LHVNFKEHSIEQLLCTLDNDLGISRVEIAQNEYKRMTLMYSWIMLGGDHNGCLPKKIETVHEENLECAG
jgi:hypothetical protein